MIKTITILLVGLFFSASNAFANTELVFQCMTKSKKIINIESTIQDNFESLFTFNSSRNK